MNSTFYNRLKEKALKTAHRLGLPAFYEEYENCLRESSVFFDNSSIIYRCLQYLDDSALHPAHGISHCEKVAREAGAIVLIERGSRRPADTDPAALMLCAQVAGLFHDIKRSEENHTVAGSREAERILKDFDIEDRYKRYIIAAIRNHEAFKKVLDSEDASAKLVSDSLYDADKFRWGPDNFTVTLWLITESRKISVRTLFDGYQEKMEGIARIKETFRTPTGQQYGPEFIDIGIEIGREIYKEMHYMIGDL